LQIRVNQYCYIFHKQNKIQDVRDYAATLNDPAGVGASASGDAGAAEAGMAEMSQKFRDMGGEVYVEAEAVKASNRVL
jgi:phosphomethylpyrimidine synthase